MIRYKRAFGVSALVVLNILTSLIYQFLWAYYFGAGPLVDAFLASTTIPTVIMTVTMGTLNYAFVPAFVESLTVGGEEAFTRVASGILNLTFLMLTILSWILVILAPYLVRILVPGFSLQLQNLTISMLRVQLFSLPLLGAVSVLTSWYYALERFTYPTLAPVIASTAAGSFIVIFSSRLDIWALVWATVIYAITQVAFLTPILLRSNYSLQISFNDPVIRLAIKSASLLIAGSAYYKSDILFERIIASYLPAGSISYLGYAGRIIQVLTRFSTQGLATTTFPDLSRHSLVDRKSFENLLGQLFSHVSFICFPIAITLVLFLESVLRLVFANSAFLPRDATNVALATAWLSGVLIAGALGTVLANAFYALQDIRTMTLIGIIAFTIGIFLKLIGAHYWGVQGVALATSGYFLLGLVMEATILNTRHGIRFHRIISPSLKPALCSLGAGVLSYAVYESMPEGIIELLLGVFVFGAVYLFLGNLLRVYEVEQLRELVRKRSLPLRRYLGV